jgi:hypothetical protein
MSGLQTFARRRTWMSSDCTNFNILFSVQTSISEPAHFVDEQTTCCARCTHLLLLNFDGGLSNIVVITNL